MSDVDPVLVRRAKFRRVASIGQRIGFGIYALDAIAFFVALAVGFTSPWPAIVTTGLIAGSIVLAPSILLAYTVRAADREDRERGIS